MASLRIHLLGPSPKVVVAGHAQPAPRGRKVWALLAYLTLTRSAPTREWLAELLFADADDPLNALSWNLSQVRRLLGPEASLGGDPVVLTLPPETFVDAHALTACSWRQAIVVPGLGSDLLQGMSFGSPGFEAWLLTNRRRLAAAGDNVLREAARARLVSGDGPRAVELASRLVAANPLDEDAQELLVRSYAATGDRAAAEQQRDACIALFQRELGTRPGAALLQAADRPAPQIASADRTPSAAATLARLEAGLSAVQAGAPDAGIAQLRQAVAEADDVGDPMLQVRALTALGSALVHAVRGHDSEGSEVLLEAVALADRTAAPSAAAQARRELGYVELLRGRYDRATRWLEDARHQAEDAVELAWTCALAGVVHTDMGRHEEALAAFAQAVRIAREEHAGQVEAWALTFAGRLRLLRRELESARESLSAALDLARTLAWTALVPLPEAMLAEVDLLEGDLEAATARLEHAHALSIQLDDPCWEGMAGRGLALAAARRGDVGEAMNLLTRARTRCVRVPDAYLWIEGYCLEALCAIGVEHDQDLAHKFLSDLEALATRTGMKELTARAFAHRGRLGDRKAAEAARVLAAEVDNPALRREAVPSPAPP